MQIRHLPRQFDRASHLAAISATPSEVAAGRRDALRAGARRAETA